MSPISGFDFCAQAREADDTNSTMPIAAWDIRPFRTKRIRCRAAAVSVGTAGGDDLGDTLEEGFRSNLVTFPIFSHKDPSHKDPLDSPAAMQMRSSRNDAIPYSSVRKQETLA